MIQFLMCYNGMLAVQKRVPDRLCLIYSYTPVILGLTCITILCGFVVPVAGATCHAFFCNIFKLWGNCTFDAILKANYQFDYFLNFAYLTPLFKNEH